jgi:hypothetical protein
MLKMAKEYQVLAGESGGGQVLEEKLSWKYNIKIDKM